MPQPQDVRLHLSTRHDSLFGTVTDVLPESGNEYCKPNYKSCKENVIGNNFQNNGFPELRRVLTVTKTARS